MTIAHHWNSEEQTIPTRYGTAVEELIRRSSTLETGTRLALSTGDSTSQPFEINTLTGGSGKIRSTFSDCLSALGVLPRTFDCRIYSQTAAAEVAAGGLLRRLCVGGGTCGELRPSPPFALASCHLVERNSVEPAHAL